MDPFTPRCFDSLLFTRELIVFQTTEETELCSAEPPEKSQLVRSTPHLFCWNLKSKKSPELTNQRPATTFALFTIKSLLMLWF